MSEALRIEDAPRIETCANCRAATRPDDVQGVMYDDHADVYFCNFGCWREWADEDGRETVTAFYERMNIHEA